jgi:hypothetical protein
MLYYLSIRSVRIIQTRIARILIENEDKSRSDRIADLFGRVRLWSWREGMIAVPVRQHNARPRFYAMVRIARQSAAYKLGAMYLTRAKRQWRQAGLQEGNVDFREAIRVVQNTKARTKVWHSVRRTTTRLLCDLWRSGTFSLCRVDCL